MSLEVGNYQFRASRGCHTIYSRTFWLKLYKKPLIFTNSGLQNTHLIREQNFFGFIHSTSQYLHTLQSLKSSALTHGKLLTKIVFFKNSQKWYQILEVGLKIGPKI